MSRADKQRKRQKRKEKRQKQQSTRHQDEVGTPLRPVAVGQYIITYEPIKDEHSAAREIDEILGDDDRLRLFECIHETPERAIPELERLLERHPDVPTLYNWLAAAYGHAGRLQDAERVSALNYEQNPQYLFARINHAQMLLEKGEIQQVFDVARGFDLYAIYPHRTVFHATEFAAVAAVAVAYFAAVRDFPTAGRWMRMLEDVDTNEDRVMATRMELTRARLLGSPLGGVLGQMAKVFGGGR